MTKILNYFFVTFYIKKVLNPFNYLVILQTTILYIFSLNIMLPKYFPGNITFKISSIFYSFFATIQTYVRHNVSRETKI